jgi:hypothetical protein
MKREVRKHVQKYCDISNWSRMKNPRRGKQNFEAAQALSEDILRLILKNEPGYDGTAIMLAALAMVRNYVRRAVGMSNAHDYNCQSFLPDKYDELFNTGAWMGVHEDRIQFQVEDFIRGDKFWHDPLGLNK